VNVLGLTFGIDPLHLAVKLPVIGSVGLRRRSHSVPVKPPLAASEESAAAE
jgi:hypothetical protein